MAVKTSRKSMTEAFTLGFVQNSGIGTLDDDECAISDRN